MREIAPECVRQRFILMECTARTLGRQPRHELAAKHPRERMHGKEKSARWTHPRALFGQRAPGHQRMHVHMAREILLPGMQHQRESGYAPEPAGVGGELA